MPRRIATPTPARAGSTTTLGGLSRVAGAELEDRRVRRREEIETTRRHAREDLETEALQQRMGIEMAAAERDIFGVTRAGGAASLEAEAPPLTDGAPPRMRSAGAGGGEIGVRASLPAGDQPLAGPARGELKVAPRTTRQLEPARDPTIVHPELLPREPEPTFDFSSFEEDYDLPGGTLTEAFQTNPVGALNLIVDKASTKGRLSNTRMTQVRGAVQTELQRISDRLEFSSLSQDEENALAEQAESLTNGLLDLVVGPSGGFDLDAVLDNLEALYPDADENELFERATRYQRVKTGAQEFTGRARQPLEPGR